MVRGRDALLAVLAVLDWARGHAANGAPEEVGDAFCNLRIAGSHDLSAARLWHRRAKGAGPDQNEVYCNMACVHALQGQKGLALRYRQFAALNGHAGAEGIEDDPDPSALRPEPGDQAHRRASP